MTGVPHRCLFKAYRLLDLTPAHAAIRLWPEYPPSLDSRTKHYLRPDRGPIQPVGLRHRSDATARRQIPAGSYDAALQRLDLSDRYRPGRLRDNNCAENSHLSIRRRERKIRGFKSPASAQRFLEAHATVYNTFNMQQHLLCRSAACAARRLGICLEQCGRATAAGLSRALQKRRESI